MGPRFLHDTDYDDQIRVEIRQLLDKSPDLILVKRMEKKAISQMKKYLSARYDIEIIFQACVNDETDTRDSYIVMLLIDITLYHLWSKEKGSGIPQVRQDRYQDALDWLKSVGHGEEISDLPPKETGDAGGIEIYSAYPPNNHKY